MADGFVVVGRDTGHVFNLLEVIAYFLALGLDAFNHHGYRTVNTAFDVHRVSTGSHILETNVDDCLGKHCSGCGAVAGIVAGL